MSVILSFLEWESEYEEIESTKWCTNCKSSDLTFDEEYRSLESWEIDDWKLYFRDRLEDVGGEYDDDIISNSERAYIGFFKFSKWYADVLVELKFHLYYDVGYYEGANLDYEILVYNGFENSDLPVGMQKIQAKNAMKWIEKTKAETSEKIENLFSEVCDNRLELVGTFSNGESIYREIK